MSLWPFGRDKGSVEFVSRIVSGIAVDGVRLRGKLTIHFASPRRAEQAESAGDTAVLVVTELFANTSDHRRLLGDEAGISARTRQRLPDDFPELRALDVQALHVVRE